MNQLPLNQPPGGTCLFCPLPYAFDPNVRVGVSIKAWAHEPCLNVHGYRLDQLDDIVACCDSFQSLVNLCGSLVQLDPAIPRTPHGAGGEIWRAVPETKQIVRYRMDQRGRFVVVGANLPTPPAPEASTP